ncbi:hypothetical protein Tco_0606290, partial [Tanacetum coccineum]
MWRLKIEQYFQIQDYALWDIIENGPVTIEEKVQKKNDVKARSSQNMAFVSTLSSTNEVNNVNVQVSTANSSVSTASTHANTANLKQIHEDDLEEMDLKWQLALLSMRARRGPKNQESRTRNQDSSRRTVNVEETTSKEMVAIDEAGFDWSYMADEEVPTNLALIAFSDSE